MKFDWKRPLYVTFVLFVDQYLTDVDEALDDVYQDVDDVVNDDHDRECNSWYR